MTVAAAKIHGSGEEWNPVLAAHHLLPPPLPLDDVRRQIPIRDRRRFAGGREFSEPSLRLENIFFRPFYRESAFSRNASVLFLTGQTGVNSESERVAVARNFSRANPPALLIIRE